MKAVIKFAEHAEEIKTAERCFISEVSNDANDSEVSIASARVAPGVTTAWHKLNGVTERYLTISGQAKVDIEGLEPTMLKPGDVVIIPPDVAQRITNIGSSDLLFYCICSPRFHSDCYHSLE
ncbi:MAG: cupin domain-containing protein [Candidatus Polarisedimenticolaceae bacterium]|nr:cupin domain-containing protein [Candidatus Polarisedimenticolaceae bacterium]